MGYIKSVISEEYERLKALCQTYGNKIKSFPEGTVSIKKRKKREYLYLAKRQGGSVRFHYIGPAVSDNVNAGQKIHHKRRSGIHHDSL